MYFELVKGKYTTGMGADLKIHKVGDIINSDSDLCKKFRNKFRRVAGPKAKEAPVFEDEVKPTPVATKIDASIDESEAKPKTPTTKVGTEGEASQVVKNMTAKFPGAADAGVSVVKIGKVYVVKEAGSGTVLTDPPLAKRSQVNAFIETMLS